jgi:hypothetical protein
MFDRIISLLRTLVALAQERNNLALESLSELRDANKHLREIEQEQDQQTAFLKEIAADLKPPAPGPAASLVITLGKAIPQ